MKNNKKKSMEATYLSLQNKWFVLNLRWLMPGQIHSLNAKKIRIQF